jgi:hypothetical protein
MNKEEAQAYEDKRRRLLAALKDTFPTIVSVLETSEERSRLDRAENARKRAEALRNRRKKGTKP